MLVRVLARALVRALIPSYVGTKFERKNTLDMMRDEDHEKMIYCERVSNAKTII